jgi:hypothetical protein
LEQLKKELNDEGPIREDDFAYRSQLKNLKVMLNEEGYDEQELSQAMKIQDKRQNELMLKTIRRMQHYNKENYLKPKFFDRWREFIQYKRMFRYWLSFVDKRS